MTRKEKINQLNDIFAEINEDDNAVCYLTSEDNELIESAIEALEQQPCEDAISRQAAIDALDKRFDEIPMEQTTEILLLRKDLRTLPPVQPKYNTSEWCHDCSEYNQEKHCCPRFNKVIRNTVKEIKQAKVGHWISYWDEEARCYVYKCPECGNKQPFDTKCCWECGTRLIEPQESEVQDAGSD
jgi:hypothetical protein